MVRCLNVMSTNLHISLCFCGCLKQHLLKEGVIDEVGARGTEQERIGRKLLHRQAVDFLVPSAGIIHVLTALCKRGRIEDDDVEV